MEDKDKNRDIPAVSGPDYPRSDGPAPLPIIKGYQIIKQLGEGGMGIVYLAEQTEHIKRQVALKIIKPGMDSEQVIARFEAERQALALLDHSSIAHIYDAGTTDKGRPYFVMEYVQGQPITEYCDSIRMTIEERLQIFIQVCNAIQHAHQKGIIHRDIKHSNILVADQDGKPIPKVIDFGVAKAISQPMTERTMFTEQGQFVGTPEYMAPEQCLDITYSDTRSDVYSLGVLLYLLLIGTPPLDPQVLRTLGIEQMKLAISETDIEPPSKKLMKLKVDSILFAISRQEPYRKVVRNLMGGLDWIALKALARIPAERYQSVSELITDIRNFLNNEPVLAHPPSIIYRLNKFSKRHRPTIIICIMIIGTSLCVKPLRIYKDNNKSAFLKRGVVLTADNKVFFTTYSGKSIKVWLPNLDSEVITLGMHEKRIWSTVVSPDGKYYATAGSDNIIKLWNTINLSLSKELRGHENSILGLAFNPDSKLLASCSKDTTIKIWDANEGILKQTLNGHSDAVWFITFSADGRSLLSVSMDKTMKLWDVETGTEIAKLEGQL